MKATINELWDTQREIISFDNSEFDRPTSISDLKKCENVVIIKNRISKGITEVLIDDRIYLITLVKINHPSGGGVMYVLEVN